MSIEGKNVIILVENDYQELELWYPLLRLREEGVSVQVVGPKANDTYRSKLGYPVKAELKPSQVDLANVDAVIIPGGYAPDHMRTHEGMVEIVREAYAQGKIVAAICHAVWMLVSANILSGKKATCYYSIKDDVKNAGAEYLDQAVVRDGNIITSRIPDDLPEFMKTIIDALS